MPVMCIGNIHVPDCLATVTSHLISSCQKEAVFREWKGDHNMRGALNTGSCAMGYCSLKIWTLWIKVSGLLQVKCQVLQWFSKVCTWSLSTRGLGPGQVPHLKGERRIEYEQRVCLLGLLKGKATGTKKSSVVSDEGRALKGQMDKEGNWDYK